jgi:hypothetical protein
MILPETAKPATETVSGLRNVEQLGGQLDKQITETTAEIQASLKLQASRLVRLYAVNGTMAETIAPLVFLEVAP